MVLTTKYQLMLLIVWVLAIFYRTQFADVCLVDDYGSLTSILTQEHFSLREIFFPRSDGGGYYRPLIGVSYWLDKELWFLASKNLHLESILGHLLNCILVFFIVQKVSQLCLNTRDNYLPFFAALLFSVHPIVTESVNWISGRTDIMMSNFLLISLLCILQYKLSRSRLSLIAGLLSAVVAMLAKETALGFIIGLPLLLWYKPEANNDKAQAFRLVPFFIAYALSVTVVLYSNCYGIALGLGICYLGYLQYKDFCSGSLDRSVVQVRLFFLVPMLMVAALIFVVIRKTVFTSSVGKIGQTITLMLGDINYTISVFFGAIGFYVKKFFLPLPLNFFILEISPLYDLLGIAVFLGIMYFLTSKDMSAILALMGFLLLAPALPFAFGTIAWSGYAERYLYLPSAFWLMAISLKLNRLLDSYPHLVRPARITIVLLCIIAGSITFYRNGVWQSNVSLMKDTVSQTPNMRTLQDIYIRSLLNAGMTADAERQYESALADAPPGYNVSSDLALGGELVKQGRKDNALALYQNVLIRTRFTSEAPLTAAIDLLRSMQNENQISGFKKQQLHAVELEYVAKRLIITKSPRLMLEKGNDALAAGSITEATAWFTKALDYVSPRDYKLRKTLEEQKIKSEGQR